MTIICDYHEYMTAKEKLREHVESLTEDDAAKALRLLGERLGGVDPLLDNPDVAPLDDESLSPEDEVLIQEGRDDTSAGRTVSREEIQAKYG